MKTFTALPCASFVSALLLSSVLGAAITPLSPRDSATSQDGMYPNSDAYTNSNSSALDAADPSVMTNLLRGSNRIKQDFGGAVLAYIDAQSPLSSQGVPRDQPELLTDIKLSFETAGERQRGVLRSNGNTWGRWGVPRLIPSPFPPTPVALPFDIPNLKVPIPTALSVISAKDYPGNLIRYYINTSGRETLVSYKFHIGEWLITVDAISGKISHASKWRPNDDIANGVPDESTNNSSTVATS